MRRMLERRYRHLARDLETERFHLKSLGRWDAMRLTLPWRNDTEILLNIKRSSKPLSVWEWFRSGPIPNNVYPFVWAITPKDGGELIGVHTVAVGGGYRTASMLVVVHDRDWWGKGVVMEVRPRLINHVFDNSDVERFKGSVNGRNIPSIFNYKRLGFADAGTWHRQHRDPVTREYIDVVQFELLKENWEKGSHAGK